VRRHKPIPSIVNFPLTLPHGETLIVAPFRCTNCGTPVRPPDIELEPLIRLICRSCHRALIEVTPRCA
jgi:hypothetical protein